MTTPILDDHSLILRKLRRNELYQQNYYAMYSSVYGGIVTNPEWMLIPVDDHVVHRGDGVFETVKCVNGNIYNWEAHLLRLKHSAHRLQMPLPVTEKELINIICDTICAGEQKNASIRVLLTRGPGGLSANPYECPESQIYIIVSALGRSFMEKKPEGAHVGISSVPVKHSLFATIKSCNYLPNVLMTREAVDRGFDFMVAFDENGYMTEGATENLGVVTKEKILTVPRMNNILAGTTMGRILFLAEKAIDEGLIKGVEHQNISLEEMQKAPEILVFGTTRDVTAVVKLEEHIVGEGIPGPVYQKLSELIKTDILYNKEMHTAVGF